MKVAYYTEVTFEELQEQRKQETVQRAFDKETAVRAPLQSLPSILITATVLSFYGYEERVHVLLS